MNVHPLWNQYPSLKKELEQTLELMASSINLSNKEVEAAILDMINSGGKLLRPAYLLLFSQFGKKRELNKMMALAASMETLHTATLIHDDIIDEADTRRNSPTVQATFGKDVAVYAGDYLFVSCFKLVAKYASSLKSVQLNVDSMEKVLNGELGQMDQRYNYDVSVNQYLDNISGKTAELFSLSCFLGAFEAGASTLVAKSAKEIGHDIGMAFQILDDILDYSQSETTIGKPVLEDMKQGVYSLPLLCALETHREQLVPLLDNRHAMTSIDTQMVYDIIQQANAVEQARQLAHDYTEKALKAINKLPKNNEQTKEILSQLTHSLLKRSH
ncbi:polyprenyl synthetase family protein [Vagococcus zengguangii]|uniref:Polyprenyl synthetase family protein n=1 Tax=Vagococcus zengguangii TaxID=2571750 RepID=A0A4D7CS60_9ENTE|nr:polyprenyl synthetase family protein [Vagococcus zengguangii]QCI85457.1 polyprenyl synthetase family protein [Vagococcus zengguangii]TLG80002.1 polyprenyl synthetase family protein [Vagococcus zengguangii]